MDSNEVEYADIKPRHMLLLILTLLLITAAVMAYRAAHGWVVIQA